MIKIFVNGSPEQVSHDTTVHNLLNDLGQNQDGIAVALNEDVIPRSEWNNVSLSDGDKVEVIGAVQGG